jgi:repressor of nif and glnA expression
MESRVTVDESHQVAREKMAILRILANAPKAMGSKVIARLLRDEYGIELSERAVRYHLGLLDERGLTSKVSRRDGRQVTELGMEEMGNALVSDKVGFVIDKIELLAYQTTFDPRKRAGLIPINFSLFPQGQFKAALKAMAPCFQAGICVSDLVAMAEEGHKLAGITIPAGQVGFATVCSIVINGVLLKEGIPTDSRFGGILQFNNHKPWRFSDLIQYSGSSLDPSEIFIAGRMTSICQAVKSGDGKVLANFREIPAMSLSLAEKLFARLKAASINGPLALGEASKPVCEVPVGLNKVGVVLAGGLNPVAAAVEAGCMVSNKAMSRVIEFAELQSFWEI